MLTWRGVALGIGLCVGFAAACGDDPAKRAVRGSDAGAAGESDEPSAAGAGATPGAVGGAGGEGGAAPLFGVDLATYCQTIGETYSAWLTFCYGSDAYPVSEADEFAANSEQSCLLVAPGVEAGRLVFDGVVAAACLATIDTTNCDGFTFVEGTEACQGVLSGTVEPGGACWGATHFSVSQSECANGFCDVSAQVCPGECVALQADGEACEVSAQCLPGSWCSEEVCTPRPAIGEACSADACPTGASCVTAPEATEGVCVARSQAGQPCDESEPCSFGFYCLGGECHSKVATGDPCAVRWHCAEGERCVDRDGEGPTCGEPGGHNVPCGQSADCVADHYCGLVEPTLCLPRVAVGLACTVDGQCVAGAWCNLEFGECQAPGGAGDSCLMNGFPSGSPQACEAGLKCMTNGQCHPVGAEGDPCHTVNTATCEDGLYCSLDGATCQLPAEQGEPCNPYSPATCAGELGCTCDDAACSLYSFALPHTCLPRRADGEPCFGTAECAVGSSCLGMPEGECVPDPVPCIPE